MSFRKKSILFLISFLIVFVLSSCDVSKIVSPPPWSSSPSASNDPIIETATPDQPRSQPPSSPSQIPAWSWTPPPSPTEPPEIIPDRPAEYTDAKYFTFEQTSGTITGYDIQGGLYVNIPPSINGYNVKILGSKSFAGISLYGVMIPDTVSEIQIGAFEHCTLKIAEIPDSVKTIGGSAFYHNRLESINLPSGLVHLGDSAFGLNELKEIVIPETITTINEGAFSSNKLVSVYIPDNVKAVHNSAFHNNKLESVRLPEGIKKISYYSFSDNLLTNIIIPESVEVIERFAFLDNRISHITIPANVKMIGQQAFAQNMISELYLHDNLESLGRYAFYHNKISKLHIGKGLTHIPESCFLINSIEDIVIPDNIKSVEWSAFCDNESKTLYLGNGLETIGEYAFSGNLFSEITIPDNVEILNDNSFSNNPVKSLTFQGDISYIGYNAFSYKDIEQITCIKNSYPEYFFKNKAPDATITTLKTHSFSFSLTREEIINENIVIKHKLEYSDEKFYFLESIIREYIMSKYGPSCSINSIDMKTDELIQDEIICDEGIVYIPVYNVSYEYDSVSGPASYDADIHAILVKTDDGTYFLGGVEESDMNFKDKHVLYDYLVKDTRFNYMEIPEQFDGIIANSDIQICDDFIETVINQSGPITFSIDNVEHILFETEYSIYLKNTQTNDTVPVLLLDYWGLNGYRILGKVDDSSFAYTKIGHGGFDGVYIYDLLDNGKVELSYKDQAFYMIPVYTGEDYLIVAHGDDHSSKFTALYKLDFSESKTGKITKLTDDFIYYREYSFSRDHKYMVYVTSRKQDESSNYPYYNRYVISDDFECYTKHVKVIDLATMQVVKSGRILENVKLYYPDTQTHWRLEYMQFSFVESTLYMKYRDVCFSIDLN